MSCLVSQECATALSSSHSHQLEHTSNGVINGNLRHQGIVCTCHCVHCLCLIALSSPIPSLIGPLYLSSFICYLLGFQESCLVLFVYLSTLSCSVMRPFKMFIELISCTCHYNIPTGMCLRVSYSTEALSSGCLSLGHYHHYAQPKFTIQESCFG